MHPVKKKGNIQWVLMRYIIILKLPFVVCVSSGPSVMKWLWHFISDSCEDERGNRWFSFITEQLFMWVQQIHSQMNNWLCMNVTVTLKHSLHVFMALSFSSNTYSRFFCYWCPCFLIWIPRLTRNCSRFFNIIWLKFNKSSSGYMRKKNAVR